MASRTLLARNGKDRLVIKTICTHLLFFHEAGYMFRTERRHAGRWIETEAAIQPIILSCFFNGRLPPEHFGATPQARPGFYKLSSEVMSIRRHCVWVDTGAPMPPQFVAGATDVDARAVRDVQIRFTYDNEEQTLRHSG